MNAVNSLENLIITTIHLSENDKGAKVDADLAPLFPCITQHTVKPYIKSTMGNSALYLPVNDKNPKMRAIVTYSESDTTAMSPRFRLYCALLHKSHILAYGFRFEAPEKSSEISRHGFYHAQLIFDDKKVTKLKSAFLPSELLSCALSASNSRDKMSQVMGFYEKMSFKPYSVPAFPLPASNSTELLMCLLISLYGWPKFYSDWITNPDAPEEIRKCADHIAQAMGKG